MKVQLAYGKGNLEVNLPDNCKIDIIEPKFEKGVPDQVGAVRAALQSPTGTKPLAGMAKESDRVGIIFSDISRATPYNILLPAIFAEIPHVPVSNITLYNATGTHRTNTEEELKQILGPGIVGKYRIIQNDCNDKAAHRYIGTSKGGNRINILSDFLDCDVKILTGFIEPHFFAGFSGGGKAVMPGLATLETVQFNHNAAYMDHKQAIWGITEGNPLWEEVKEAAGFAKPSILLNVALNRKKEITAVFAGDYIKAHREGCEYVKKHAMAGVKEPYDIILTSNSGYPLDLNMYQAVKGMSAASQIVKEGGHIIITADCWDGIPEHGKYGQLLSSVSTLDELLAKIRRPGFVMQDMWQAQIHALICKKADVHFYSDNLTDEQIKMGFMKPCRDIEKRVAEIVKSLGRPASICVIPEGPQTIPYIAG
ncbi:MAG: nickel-dependent lactate racemase [Spirochaetia bacterium]|jgi:nickel-dependent lactate racemase|nr:nickel-dependent lactate racemase [Spirochaetia bacterium]